MNIIFDNVKIYKVQDKLDVVIGQTFFMEVLDDFPPDMEVFHSKDPRVSIADDDRTVTATKLGSSIIKFMTGDVVHKNLEINVVDATHPIATTLNGLLGEPQPKP